MKLQISQMVEGENPFHFESDKDGWVKDVLHHVEKQGYHVQGNLTLDLNITKLEPDYYMRGRLSFKVSQICSRCAEAFPLPLNFPFEMGFVHAANVKSQESAASEESEELDVNFFEGNEIDLSPIVEEQFFLSIPYQALCKPDCNGICQQCGQNLNFSQCNCKKEIAENPFSVLQRLKR